MFEVKLTTEGLNTDEEFKVRKAAEKFERVFNHDRFKEWVLGFNWNLQVCTGSLWWKKCHYEKKDYFHYAQNMTRFQVYTALMEGRESLGEIGESGDAELFLKVDRRNSRSVIGYTYPNTRWQWIYQNVLRSYTIDDISANLSHEWCHKIGFNHEYKYTYARQYSVPYAVGYFVGSFKL